MLNLKKMMALAIIATFLASILLTFAGNNQELASATYTIEVDNYYAKPGGTPGGGKGTAGYSLTGYKWRTLPLTLVITPTGSGISDENFVYNTIISSAEEWDDETSTELVSTYQISYTASVSDESTADGANEIVFGNLGDTRIIAQCTYWYNPYTKELVDFDIVFNTQFTWGDAGSNPSIMDLQNIATHELGHGFGLGDLYQRKWSDQTMFGYASEGQINKRTLESGDIAGIKALYG